MLWAIDVGNTHTVFGLWDGVQWVATWRLATNVETTEDELAAILSGLCTLQQVEFAAEQVVIASVVPAFNVNLDRLCEEWLGTRAVYLRTGAQVDLEVTYEPANGVGADRIANALGGLAMADPPLILIDFGTATTFDVIDGNGTYLGGAILPGVNLSMEALARNTAKLPQVELAAPQQAIGTNTPGAIQSGVILGYACAIDGLAAKIREELDGSAVVMATGGLGKVFAEICSSIQRYEPNLTLDGLRIALERMQAQ